MTACADTVMTSRVERPRELREIAAIAGVLALSLALRLAWVLLIPEAQYSDSVWYDAAANNLLTTGTYGLDHPVPGFRPAIRSC